MQKQRKQRQREKESFYAAQFQAGAFFLFQAVIGFFSSNRGAIYIKTRAHLPNGQHHRMPGMPCLVERFLQRSGGFFLRKCTVFMGKKISMHLSRYEKT